MTQNFILRKLPRFEEQVIKLTSDTHKQLEKCLRLLSTNPRHPSLKTHIVKGSFGVYGGNVFEAYVSKQYRITFEYGKNSVIILRNVDNHDDCLRKP